jgi:hypothetical protein
VECGTSDQAMRSLVHLRSVLQEGLQQANSERTFTEAPHKSRNQTC